MADERGHSIFSAIESKYIGMLRQGDPQWKRAH